MQCKVVGVMSGTSLDGVDQAFCTFQKDKHGWGFTVHAAETIPYSDEWRKTLATIHSKSSEELAFTHVHYGKFLGNLVKEFLNKHHLKPDFISSHGHTVFHQPSKRFTLQIGEGAALSVACGFPVVCDFRTTDVALRGQGAPLVPIGD